MLLHKDRRRSDHSGIRKSRPLAIYTQDTGNNCYATFINTNRWSHCEITVRYQIHRLDKEIEIVNFDGPTSDKAN